MPTAEFSITSIDSSLPSRLLGIEAVAPIARQIHHACVVVYHGSQTTSMSGRQRHDFTVEFTTDNSAGVVANWMWTELHGHVSSLAIGGDDVPVQNGAIKRALLAHATAV